MLMGTGKEVVQRGVQARVAAVCMRPSKTEVSALTAPALVLEQPISVDTIVSAYA